MRIAGHRALAHGLEFISHGPLLGPVVDSREVGKGEARPLRHTDNFQPLARVAS